MKPDWLDIGGTRVRREDVAAVRTLPGPAFYVEVAVRLDSLGRVDWLFGTREYTAVAADLLEQGWLQRVIAALRRKARKPSTGRTARTCAGRAA